ncbi:MAG: GNAT family N-acetyltransferase [Bacteroidia bacterium]|nr:GNAT family N-acetyltransferase [Bacteroidia bacterium]MDW8159074.1 GNAT family N-acetyltransferase [Bacteroidia bacterium]
MQDEIENIENDFIQLEKLNRFNWEPYAKLEVHPYQKEFIPDNLFSIAQSCFEPAELYGISYKQKAVGLIIINKWNNLYWISRIMVDKNWQNKGIGYYALQQTIHLLKKRRDYQEIRTSIAVRNTQAQQFFKKVGFEFLHPIDEWEVMYVYRK